MKQKSFKIEKGCLVVKQDELEEIRQRNALVANVEYEVDSEGFVTAKIYICRTYWVVDDEGKKVCEEFGNVTNFLLKDYDGTTTCRKKSPKYDEVEECEKWVKRTIEEIENRRNEIAKRRREMKKELKNYSIVMLDEKELKSFSIVIQDEEED